MVSSIGYDVLSGKIQVERHDTTFLTLKSNEHCKTLSLISRFSRKKSKLCVIFWKSPPTRAAKWMTCVGRCFSKIARVSAAELGVNGVRKAFLTSLPFIRKPTANPRLCSTKRPTFHRGASSTHLGHFVRK